MNPGFGRKGEFICHCSDEVHYLKRPKEVRGKLQIFVQSNGFLAVAMESSVNPIVNLKLSFNAMLVRVMFHTVLGLA
jgi:hypothetical protein